MKISCPFCDLLVYTLDDALLHIINSHSLVKVGGRHLRYIPFSDISQRVGTIVCWCGMGYQWRSGLLAHLEEKGLCEHLLDVALGTYNMPRDDVDILMGTVNGIPKEEMMRYVQPRPFLPVLRGDVHQPPLDGDAPV